MNDPQFDAGYKDPATSEQTFGPEPPRSERGCFFYGCLISVIVAVLGLIAIGAIAYMGFRAYTQFLNDWTAAAPAQLPKLESTEAEREDAKTRWREFRASVDTGEAKEIVLSSDDLNALIQENDDIKDKIYVTIEDDKIVGELSIPLGETGLPRTAGRFLNGKGTLKVSLIDGLLVVTAPAIEVNGKPLPEALQAGLANENLAASASRDPDNAKFFKQFESLQVKDGKVTIKTKAKEAKQDDKAESKEATPMPEPEGAKPPEAKPEPKSEPEATPKAA